jgi:hypothetical protein
MSANSNIEMANQSTDAQMADARWKGLYRVGGAAILITLGLYLTELIVFSVANRPFPATLNDWFSLFQESKLLGLFYLNSLDMVSIALMGPMFLALYMALRQEDETWMTVAVFFALVGIPVFITPRSASLAMLSLSDKFAAVTTEAQRTQILTIGESTTLGQPTPQTMGFLFIAVGVLIISVVMLRSRVFGKVTAYVGMLSSLLTIIGFISVAVAPPVAQFLMVTGMAPWAIWWILIARRLLQLGRPESQALPKPL